ncbi:MAG: PKD domain-containing protein [Puia sp.]
MAADPRPFINGRLDSTGCVPLDVLFKDTVHNAKSYVWTFGDGTPDTTTTAFQVIHTYTNIGTYTVRLIAIDPPPAILQTRPYLTIRVRTDKAILNFDISKLPPCQSLNYMFTNTSTPPAGKPFQPGSFTWNFGGRVALRPARVRSHIRMLRPEPIWYNLFYLIPIIVIIPTQPHRLYVYRQW